MEKNVHIYLEASPNPDSLKFVASEMLLAPGQVLDFASKAEAADEELALQVFAIEGVERVFFMSNFMTVTKAADKEWIELQNEIKALFKTFLEKEGTIGQSEADEPEPAVAHNDMDLRLISILDEYVKPAVEMDGGHIQFKSFEQGTVTVELQGSCSGCPSASQTLKAGIENLLKRMVPEVEKVEAEEV